MPGPNFGYSFAPTAQAAEEGRRGGSPATASAGPLQVLNYSLPTGIAEQSVNAISPLVSSERRGKTLADTVLASVLRTVFGDQDAQALLSSPAMAARQDPAAAAPSPSIMRPGVATPSNPSPAPGGIASQFTSSGGSASQSSSQAARDNGPSLASLFTSSGSAPTPTVRPGDLPREIPTPLLMPMGVESQESTVDERTPQWGTPIAPTLRDTPTPTNAGGDDVMGIGPRFGGSRRGRGDWGY